MAELPSWSCEAGQKLESPHGQRGTWRHDGLRRASVRPAGKARRERGGLLAAMEGVCSGPQLALRGKPGDIWGFLLSRLLEKGRNVRFSALVEQLSLILGVG